MPSSVDGKRLHNAVFRPDTSDPVPVFINFSPYWADSAMEGGDNFARHLVDLLVPRGYAVVLSAVRGTGHSEGCFQIGGDLELQDAHDVIAHFADAAWSNGAVAAGGKSYDSTTQNGVVAKVPHPALKGIFHVSGITDMYRYNYREGVPYANGLAFTPRYFATQSVDEQTASPTGEDEASLLRLVDDAACPELPRHVASGEGSALSGQKDAYWMERDWNRYLPASPWNGSVFFVHGLQDWNVKPDHILPWLSILQQKGIPTLAWLHQDTYINGHVYPMREDWNATMLAWLEWSLKGDRNGFDRHFGFESQGTDGVWRRSAAWPPTDGELRVPLAAGESRATHAADAPLRITGVVRVEMEAVPLTTDPVLSAVFTVNGQWVGEAVLRGMYRDGLEDPSPVLPVPTRFALESYPLDVVLREGDELAVEVMREPRHTVPMTHGTLVADVTGEALFPLAPLDGALVPQPTPTRCWAC